MPNADLLEVDDMTDAADDGGPGAPSRPNAAGWRRVRWGRVVLAVAAVLVAYYLVTLFQVWGAGREHTPAVGSADVIVVLGAAQYDGRPSPQLAARLDHGLALWQQGVAPLIMVTGGNRPGDRFTEAEAGFGYLVDRGVPAEAILREDVGTTTYSSLEAAAGLLLAQGHPDVVLVTDPYHSLRSRLIADEVGLDATLSPAPNSVVTGRTSLQREIGEAAGVALGRLVGFDRLTELVG